MRESKEWATGAMLLQADAILEQGKAQGYFTYELAEKFDVPESIVCRILDGEVVDKKYTDRIIRTGEAIYMVGRKMWGGTTR